MSNSIKHCKDCDTTVMCHLERRCMGQANGLPAAAGSEYAAEMVAIRKDWLYHAAHHMRLGIESMREELARHDASLGRDRPRAKRAAEMMERDIAEGEKAMNRLFDFQNKKLYHECNEERM